MVLSMAILASPNFKGGAILFFVFADKPLEVTPALPKLFGYELSARGRTGKSSFDRHKRILLILR
jgi:hypothetical protein